MATTHLKRTVVEASKKMKVEYEFRTFLGLIGWWREAKTTQFDDDLHMDIYKPEQYKNVFINGKKFNL